MKNIPVFVIEEHNEALYVWKYCIQNNLMDAKENVLLHIDEHSDMSVPRFNNSLLELDDCLKSFKTFVTKQVGIASFIVPSIYLKIFNCVIWMKQQHRPLKNNSRDMFVRSYNNDGFKLMLSEYTNPLEIQQPDVNAFKYILEVAAKCDYSGTAIVDIDLDYFSCTGSPTELKPIFIEVTASEYEEFIKNPYHRIRYLGPKMEARIVAGRFYLSFNEYTQFYCDAYPFNLKVSNQVIDQRINELALFLTKNKINPVLFTICRSRFSGYTPEDQWEYIENKLMEMLKGLYSIDIKHINQI